jgi:hypothetical protein
LQPNKRRSGNAGDERDTQVIEPMAEAMNAKSTPRSLRYAWLARILGDAVIGGVARSGRNAR